MVRRTAKVRRVTLYRLHSSLRPNAYARDEGRLPTHLEEGNWYGGAVPEHVEELLMECGVLLEDT